MTNQEVSEPADYQERLINALKLTFGYIAPNNIFVTSIFSFVMQLFFWYFLFYCFPVISLTEQTFLIPVALIVTVIAGVIHENKVEAYRAKLTSRLHKADLIERLATGSEQITHIFEHVSFPWHYFLGPKPKDLRASLELLVTNVDWYLEEPRSYINSAWVWKAMERVVDVIILVVVIMGAVGIIEYFIIFAGLTGLSVPTLYLFNYHYNRRHIAIHLIHDELVKRFQDEVTESTSGDQ